MTVFGLPIKKLSVAQGLLIVLQVGTSQALRRQQIVKIHRSLSASAFLYDAIQIHMLCNFLRRSHPCFEKDSKRTTRPLDSLNPFFIT